MRSNGLTVIVVSAALVFAGCQKRTRVVALPPPPPPAAAPAPPSVAAPLAQADQAFSAGNYEEAARAYDNYLRANPAGTQRDHALFQMGLAQALRPAPTVDWSRAIATFKQLTDEFPSSPLKPAANLILSLRSEIDQVNADSKQRDVKIKQLTTELDRLKKIDAERRRRP